MECRTGCGACCIAITISSPIPGMPDGKPAGVPCRHLTEEKRCGLFFTLDRPKVCDDLKASLEMCGSDYDDAYAYLTYLEKATEPIKPIKTNKLIKVEKVGDIDGK